jgi:hypothetical protein
VEKKVIELYQTFVREKEAQERMAERINRWKSVAPK